MDVLVLRFHNLSSLLKICFWNSLGKTVKRAMECASEYMGGSEFANE